jgi:hypothetical protein
MNNFDFEFFEFAKADITTLFFFQTFLRDITKK